MGEIAAFPPEAHLGQPVFDGDHIDIAGSGFAYRKAIRRNTAVHAIGEDKLELVIGANFLALHKHQVIASRRRNDAYGKAQHHCQKSSFHHILL